MEVWLQGGYESDSNHEFVWKNAINRGRALMCKEVVQFFTDLALPEPVVQQEKEADEE
jgi:hypothetical protein